MRNKLLVIFVSGALAAPSVALAHHSFAMFDKTRTIELHGVVKEFQWVNPHTWIELAVRDSHGKVVEWAIEGRSPNVLSRRGWRKDLIHPGDMLTVKAYPLRDGTPGGAAVRVTLASGQQINADTPTAVDTDEEGPRQ